MSKTVQKSKGKKSTNDKDQEDDWESLLNQEIEKNAASKPVAVIPTPPPAPIAEVFTVLSVLCLAFNAC